MGEQPWAGVRANEVFAKVSRGQHPQLSLDLVSLDGCQGLDDMVQLLWAQDPTIRPPLRDVARRLRGISPPLPLPLPPPREVEHDDEPFDVTNYIPEIPASFSGGFDAAEILESFEREGGNRSSDKSSDGSTEDIESLGNPALVGDADATAFSAAVATGDVRDDSWGQPSVGSGGVRQSVDASNPDADSLV